VLDRLVARSEPDGGLGAAALRSRSEALMPLLHLEDVAPRSVWHGETLEFLVDWNSLPDAALSLSATPAPKGALSLEKVSEDELTWCLRYAPDTQDVFPFVATLTASAKGVSETVEFAITPMEVLPDEDVVFGAEGRPGRAEPLSIEKPRCEETESVHTYAPGKPVMRFNGRIPESGAPLKLRKVRITGETVVFDKTDDKSRLFERFNGKDDIEAMEIVALKLVVRSRLHLPQTDIVVYAKEVLFETGEGCLCTTPLKKPGRPGMSEDGMAGTDAGKITLHVAEFHSVPEGVERLDLTGGDGQDGGEGRNGGNCEASKDGRWVVDMGNEFHDLRLLWPNQEYKAPDDHKVVYVETYINGFPNPQYNLFPKQKDISAASMTPPWKSAPPGHPGEPGNGGNVAGSVDFSTCVRFPGGRAGMLPDCSYYYAGRKGAPEKWVKIFYFGVFPGIEWFKEMERGEAGSGGETYHVPDFAAKKAVGGSGSFHKLEDAHSWLHPSLVQMAYVRSRDDYLEGRHREASHCFDEYVSRIDARRAVPSWSGLSRSERSDLLHLRDEMRRMSGMITGGMDYFGNPSGWTPLLSFEANKAAFEQEISSAASVLFYAYVTRSAEAKAEKKLESLRALRQQLEADSDSCSAAYSEELRNLSSLEDEASNLDVRTIAVKEEIRSLEEYFEAKAKLTAMEISALRLTGKVAGTIVSMVPVGQPATAIVGSGISLISDFDPKKPWDTVLGAVDIAGKYAKSGFSDKAKSVEKEIKSSTSKAKASKSQKELIEACEALSESGSALGEGVKEIKECISSTSESDEIVKSQMAYLESTSPEYQSLLVEVDRILGVKEDLVRRIQESMDQVESLCSGVLETLKAMEALHREESAIWEPLDARATEYVEELERRAWDRLLEYHYAFAKAYEFRLLKAYPNRLDAEMVIKRLEDHAKGQGILDMDVSTFKNAYSIVFTDYLAEISRGILEEFNTQAGERSCKLEYFLDEDQIATLNGGGVLEIDFSKLLPGEESLRIAGIGVLAKDPGNPRKGEIETTWASDETEKNGYIDLEFEHAGISRLRRGTQVYKFVHPSRDGVNPLQWSTRYTPDADVIDVHSPSAASESLLKSLLKDVGASDLLLYSRPSLWSVIRISKTGYPSKGASIHLKRCALEITYDYVRSDTRDHVDIEVRIEDTLQRSGGSMGADSTLKPALLFDEPDANQRRDARGSCLRIYKKLLGRYVTITAQSNYGEWAFVAWTDLEGNVLGSDSGNVLRLETAEDRIVCARYARAEAS
jgi:hypothetical protein